MHFDFFFWFFELNLTVDREGIVFLMSEAFMEMTFYTVGRTFTSGRVGLDDLLLITEYITLCINTSHAY
jgi:hypothetical protein